MKRLCLIAVACLAAAPAQLEPGKPIAAKLAKGETHLYSIAVPQGHYLSVKLEAFDIPLAATLAFPDGKPAVHLADIGDDSPMYLQVISTTPGTYSLSLHLFDASKGDSYTASIAEMHPATAQDRKRIDADAVYREGLETMALKDSREIRLAALVKYQRARSLWHEAGDGAGEARALKRIGWLHFRLGESRKAIEVYEQMVAVTRRIKDRTANPYYWAGFVLQGDWN